MKTVNVKAIIVIALLTLSSCYSDKNDYETISRSIALENRIVELYGSTSSLIQPLETGKLR